MYIEVYNVHACTTLKCSPICLHCFCLKGVCTAHIIGDWIDLSGCDSTKFINQYTEAPVAFIYEKPCEWMHFVQWRSKVPLHSGFSKDFPLSPF